MKHVSMIAAALACLVLAGVCPVSAGEARDEDSNQFLDTERDEFAADADADTYAGPAPLTVRFTSTTINPSGRVTYAWNFGDGSKSTERTPVHTFRKRGWYYVTMEARNAKGQTYRINLLLHAWRPRDWTRLRERRDMRIAEHAARELEAKRRQLGMPPVVPSGVGEP